LLEPFEDLEYSVPICSPLSSGMLVTITAGVTCRGFVEHALSEFWILERHKGLTLTEGRLTNT